MIFVSVIDIKVKYVTHGAITYQGPLILGLLVDHNIQSNVVFSTFIIFLLLHLW